jgi:hypothetical protein
LQYYPAIPLCAKQELDWRDLTGEKFIVSEGATNRNVALADQANSREQELRRLQFDLDLILHDLRTEFFRREQELRAAYLEDVEQLMNGEGN